MVVSFEKWLISTQLLEMATGWEGIKTQAFQKLNQKLSKLKDFVPSKLNFSESFSSLDARNEFLCNKKQINLGRILKNLNETLKLKEILASKLNKTAKTQFFGKPSHLTCRKKCEKKSLLYASKYSNYIFRRQERSRRIIS